ncbi:site-specific recombinase XerD [Limimaricola soesokkakensis]|uniref:Site-specific recombinase XerD n=1 Tax=Limimaricola soesokkakensis TaxID=1343159 RepID=A0A1X7A5T3_9RHOB|nr:tyrosine-type recombinase/integrase [Limimaricola soesokkakensis]PSK80556.1 site-specific recombinase XerD [Limimaricola soesokkakensis]SLN71058.1 Tyrosine recombinase XerC [Limimaricola soesokkakensis]
MPHTPENPALIALPADVAGSGSLDRLLDTARGYADHAVAETTRRAYVRDWAAFARWCRLKGADPLPPSPDLVGLYITDLAAPVGKTRALSVASIERRLAGLSWNYAQRGMRLDCRDRHIASVLAGIRRRHARPPAQKEAIGPDDLRAMLATLDHDLRGLRDRAMLLIGFAGALRRSELVGLDRAKDDTLDGNGWVEILDAGVLVTLRGKTGWRAVEIARGSRDATCPVQALDRWLDFAKIEVGPLFTAVSRDGSRALARRLNDRHVARLVQRTALAAGLRADLPEAERRTLFAGHSLRAGLASSAEIDERHVQKQLGHASAEMTRRYQRNRDRSRVNLSKAAGL